MIEKTANIHWILAAKRECPLSKALVSAAEISLRAKLEMAAV